MAWSMSGRGSSCSSFTLMPRLPTGSYHSSISCSPAEVPLPAPNTSTMSWNTSEGVHVRGGPVVGDGLPCRDGAEVEVVMRVVRGRWRRGRAPGGVPPGGFDLGYFVEVCGPHFGVLPCDAGD